MCQVAHLLVGCLAYISPCPGLCRRSVYLLSLKRSARRGLHARDLAPTAEPTRAEGRMGEPERAAGREALKNLACRLWWRGSLLPRVERDRVGTERKCKLTS
jgi:hypothetical protein